MWNEVPERREVHLHSIINEAIPIPRRNGIDLRQSFRRQMIVKHEQRTTL